MAKIAYINRRFKSESVTMIRQAEEICQEYAVQGLRLTLRQIYYQFVARGLMPNRQSEYKRLGALLSDARLAGDFDWGFMIDRTRRVSSLSHWDSPEEIVQASASSYRLDRWESQPAYVEVWIEKDALSGVIEGPCKALDVPFLSCRGYTSQSEVWQAGQRLARHMNDGKDVHIIHLGDHDPSGIDMTRDIEDRLTLFTEHHAYNGNLTIHRIALNMDQIQQYNPPPNPAKLTDSRAQGYIERFGRESWELDALNPTIIGDLIRDTIEPLIDPLIWEDVEAREDEGRAQLDQIVEYWEDIPVMISLKEAFPNPDDLLSNRERIEDVLKLEDEEGLVPVDIIRERLESAYEAFMGLEAFDALQRDALIDRMVAALEREAI